MKLKRDVNCLMDSDRSVRRRAVDKLHRVLQSEASHVSDTVLRALCVSTLFHPLLICAEHDVVEKCRERALTLLLFLCERGALESSDTTLKDVVALANARLGKLPYPEPAEETRLLILQLMHAFLKQLAAEKDTLVSLQDIITDLANALAKTAMDPFPDAKKMSAECVILISRNWKKDVGMQIGTIVRPVVFNLGHQHSRVRVCALQALEAAVPCGSEALPVLMKQVLLPTMSKVVLDHAASVKKQLAITLAAWFAQIEQIQQFEASILPMFLAGIVDESPEVRTLCLAKLNDISIMWEHRDENQGVKSGDVELMEVDLDFVNRIPPLFFGSRPPLGARKLAASIQAELLPPLLEKTGDWNVQVRERYTKVLSAFLILLEQSMTPETVGAHLTLITEALCDPGLRESEVLDVQNQLAGVVASIVKTAGPILAQTDDSCFRLFWVLSHLLASSSESSVAYMTANECMEELAMHLNQSVEELYVRYVGKLLDTMALPTDTGASWQKSNLTRVLFDSLCRRGGAACGTNLDKIVPVILVHLDPSQDADVRLVFLALLETMLRMDTISQALKAFSVALLRKAIIPNIVWREGHIAASIRKVAVNCAYTCFCQGIADESCLFETVAQMLPILKSSLDDSDAKTRHLACLALQHLFVALPGCLGEESVDQLYPEILKRLDDSNNTVRKAACQTFLIFLKAAPKEHFQGTIIDYAMDCLFVHLDDPEPDIQEAVYNVLRETAAIDAHRLASKAGENRSRHQSPRYCDQLLALATAQPD
ncbi:unnamed protein product [Peronospora belbahrii]|uniref:Dynein axonemal assembly factor 5 TPR repeats domain-containing protein n=1 Tax=Peronospora belbahrii TaxID=622444 RepID=A0ABN8CW57_9STRA|nr:unnamed protein product [Peronospora belbahrii]